MAEDKGLDINKIKGTGGNHRITKLDIQRVEANGYDYASDTTSNEDTSHVPTQTVDTSAIGEVESYASTYCSKHETKS